MLLMERSINPCSAEWNMASLFNIGTGKAASYETKEFLLNVAYIGKNLKMDLLKNVHEITFKEAMKRQQLHIFASEGAKRKIKSNGKVKEVKIQRFACRNFMFSITSKK